MIKKLSEKYKISETAVKGILYSLIFIVMLLFIFLINNSKSMKLEKKDMTKEEMISLFDKIKSNYSLVVEEEINGKSIKIEYSTDSKLILYEKDDKGYLIYNNIIYEADKETTKIKKTNYVIEDKLYNINFIKKIMNYCELEYVNNAKSKCSVKYSDFLNEYNNEYNTNIEINYDNILKFDVVHYSDRIVKVIVDYSQINSLINNSSDTLKYGIKIENIDKNNFDELFNYYKNDISK